MIHLRWRLIIFAKQPRQVCKQAKKKVLLIHTFIESSKYLLEITSIPPRKIGKQIKSESSVVNMNKGQK